jgi:steroid delta-isomerase-like uncharacterized protein
MDPDTKALSRHAIEEIWNKKRMEAIDELVASDCVFHDPLFPAPVQGIAAYKQFVQSYLRAFPDLHFTIEDQVAEGDSVVTRWTVTGTHRGDLAGIPASGRPVSVSGITCDRLKNGKFTEAWSSWNTLGLMQQLGVVPANSVEQAA